MFVLVAPSQAAVTEVPCEFKIDQLECSTVTVPQSRFGVAAGSVRLQVVRIPAQEGPRLGTLVVIAGGPGQSATSVMLDVLGMFDGANRYDIVAVDPRGTGFSEPLHCLSLDRAQYDIDGADARKDKPVTTCAADLGGARATYTTQEAAADLDTVRSELGLAQWTLFGVSYGTKLALAYASTYPTRVDGMLLDSVLPLDQPGAFDTDATAAMRRSFDQICTAGRCKKYLPTPASSTAKLVRQIEAQPITEFVVVPGFEYDEETDEEFPNPELTEVKVTAKSFYETFFAADFNQYIYEQLPGAIANARRGDNAMLARIQEFAGVTNSMRYSPYIQMLKKRKRPSYAFGFSDALFFATTCEDLATPWPRGTAVGSRQPSIDAAADAISDASFLPFTRQTVKYNSTATFCRGWPEATTTPTISGPLPAVPTLILNGSLDVRTPYAWAQQVAAAIPGAQLVEIPNSGHSVTGTDASGCALSLARRFLIYRTTSGKCRKTTPAVPVQDPAPASVRSVKALKGKCRRTRTIGRCRDARKTVTAGYLALRDAVDQFVVGGMPFGTGLRGGQFEVSIDDDSLFDFIFFGGELVLTSIDLSSMSHVPGVSISGDLNYARYPRVSGQFRVGGFGGSWSVSISGLLGYDMRDDALTIRARSGKRSVTLRARGKASAARKTRLSHPFEPRRGFGYGLTRP